jgi:hypothetical protein
MEGKLCMNNEKFIEELSVDGWSVKTDTGFEKITGSNKTIDYQVWEVMTEKHILRCADEHVLFNSDYSERFVKELNIGDFVITEDEPEQVISIIDTLRELTHYLC